MSAISDESVVYEISLSANAKAELAETETKVENVRELIDQLQKKIEEIRKEELKKGEGAKPESKPAAKKDEKKDEKKDLSDAAKFLESLDDRQLAILKSFASNPESMMSNQFLSLLTRAGPHAAIIAGLISSVVTAPETLTQIIKALSQKGGPFNRDFREFLEEMLDVGLTRQQLKNKQLGLDQTIFAQKKGFTPVNEAWVANNLFEINENRAARIGLSEKEQGLVL